MLKERKKTTLDNPANSTTGNSSKDKKSMYCSSERVPTNFITTF